MTSLSLRLASRLIRRLATISGRRRFIDGFCITTILVYDSKSLEVQVMLLLFMVSFETIGRVPHLHLPRAFAFNSRFLLSKCRSSFSSCCFRRSETVLLLLFSIVDNDRKLMRPSAPNVEVVPYRISQPRSTYFRDSQEWESMM